MLTRQKVILVTGASSGVGQAIARLLIRHGHQVFGTSRNGVDRAANGIELLPLDVRSDESVAACLERVSRSAGRLDVLINNAGYEQAGALEELSIEEAKAQFETNFFGVVRMVDAFLPMMRRQHCGRIINVGSLAGLAPIPFLGIYSASKFALTGYTEALRLELRPIGIQVSEIAPGFLRTPMMNHRRQAATTIGDYDPWRRRAYDAVREHEENGPGPDLAARTVLKIILSERPRLRYLVGSQSRIITGLRRFLPHSAFERGLRTTFRLESVE